MKLVIIGPVYPFKGGISHYTGLMSKSLAAEHTVINVSYGMQYPKLLYKNEQRDFANDAFKIENTQFLINTINPLSWAKTVHFIKQQQPDAVIVQWWHPWFAPCYRWICGALKKRCKIIFVCHNVLPHEKFPCKEALAKAVLNTGSGFIVHSRQDLQDLSSLVQNPSCIETVLPTYNAFKLESITKAEARRRLRIAPDTEMLLFFGFIREYKGLKHLIRALPQIHAQRPKARLYIVGDFFGGTEKEDYLQLIQHCGCSNCITLLDGYLPDKAVEPYFAACDVVVLPYESATQSAVVQVAYGFEKPVVVTDVGGLPEVVQNDKTGFVVPQNDENALAQAVIRYFAEGKAEEFAANVKAEAYKFDWQRMNENIDRLCGIQ